MNIHIIPNQKFTQAFCDLINGYYSEESNIIYIYPEENHVINKESNIININTFDDIDKEKIRSANKIFIHSFYSNSIIWYLYKNKRYFTKRKLVLIMWGADLYANQQLFEDGKLHVKERIIEYLKKIVMKKSQIFMTFAAPDYDLAKKWFGVDGKQFDCLYPSNADKNELDKLRDTFVQDGKVRVLLGNSATETNKHFEALDWLKKFSGENIEIVCPLSYGDKNYGDQVIKYGQSLFGDKFIPLLEYMTPSDYSKLLNNIDVAIFNHNRQQGTGNIEILAYLGKKIYIRSDISSWEHYVVRDNCAFFDAKTIKDTTFEEFCQFTELEKNKNIRYFRKIWDIDYVKSLWDEVFKY